MGEMRGFVSAVSSLYQIILATGSFRVSSKTKLNTNTMNKKGKAIQVQCFHSGFREVPRLCSRKSQVGVKNPKLIKK